MFRVFVMRVVVPLARVDWKAQGREWCISLGVYVTRKKGPDAKRR